MTRLTTHLRRNLVAYIALFVALGGTSYAAVTVADHSLVPAKFNAKYMGGYVRAWARINANGQVLASGGGVRAQLDRLNPPGFYIVNWRPQPTTNCTTIGSVSPGTGLVSPGYLITGAFHSKGLGEQSVVQTYGGQGQGADLPFNVELLCATPR
jgi:hypothetical protein